MNIRPVKTEEDYDAALGRIEELWGADPGTPEGDELDVLLVLVGAYEDKNHPIPPPSPIEAIRFVMEQKGLENSDLIPYLGSRPRVSEILNGKRRLTLKMIRSLHSGLGIPADILIRDHSTIASPIKESASTR
jgi:HTH-type transcriptional regulator/antitoxin HigA